jgi:hypothetical protein
MYPEAPWQNEVIKKPADIVDFKLYSKSHLPEIVTNVPLSKIVGTDHCRYYGSTWLAALYNLSRAKASDAAASERYQKMVIDNRDHSAGKQPITVRQYGDEYVLCQSGNNRICHAKFLGIPTLRVRVQQYVKDPALIKADFDARYPIEKVTEPTPLWEQVVGWALKKLGLPD